MTKMEQTRNEFRRELMKKDTITFYIERMYDGQMRAIYAGRKLFKTSGGGYDLESALLSYVINNTFHYMPYKSYIGGTLNEQGKGLLSPGIGMTAIENALRSIRCEMKWERLSNKTTIITLDISNVLMRDLKEVL